MVTIVALLMVSVSIAALLIVLVKGLTVLVRHAYERQLERDATRAMNVMKTDEGEGGNHHHESARTKTRANHANGE